MHRSYDALCNPYCEVGAKSNVRATSRESLRLCLLLDYVCMHIVHFADETQTRLHVYAVYVSSASDLGNFTRSSKKHGDALVKRVRSTSRASKPSRSSRPCTTHHTPCTHHTSHTHTSRTMHHAPHITRTPRSLTHQTSHEHFHELVSTSPTHSLTATHSLARSLTLLSSITSLLFMNGKLCM